MSGPPEAVAAAMAAYSKPQGRKPSVTPSKYSPNKVPRGMRRVTMLIALPQARGARSILPRRPTAWVRNNSAAIISSTADRRVNQANWASAVAEAAPSPA